MSDEQRDPPSMETVLPQTIAQPQRGWVERACAGDANALERLAREEAPRVGRLLRRILGPREDLDDLVQMVFVELMRALPGFRGESQISTFVGGITVRVARRALRPSAWKRHKTPLLAEPESPHPDPEQAATTQQQLRRLHQALGRIKPKKRIAFTLWALEGMSPDEIAEVTGASLSATRSRIFYAQKELKAIAARDPWLSNLLEGDDAG